jgi:hypothetical protein
MADRKQPTRRIDEPQPGIFRMRLCRKGPFVSARITRVLGILQAEINGAPADLERVWTSGEPVSDKEFEKLRDNPPDDPEKPMDWRHIPQPF